VIGGYALLITLGSQWSLMHAYVGLGVVQVTFWASLTIVVSLVLAHVVLAEPLRWTAICGAALILVAIALVQFRPVRTTVPNPMPCQMPPWV
jgi:drug/metabolite transporter (DMT)-like permease